MPRPLFNKKVTELEELFESWKDSPEQLRVLANELSHRKKPKATRLRDRVLAILETANRPDDGESAKSQKSLFADDATAPKSSTQPTSSRRSESRRTDSQRSSFSDAYAPPTEFTLIQPLGVRPRPSTFRPTLQNDVRLDIAQDASKVTAFRVALKELIHEMRRRRVGQQQFALENGNRVPTEAKGFSYQFEFAEEANIFEGASVDLVVGGRVVGGNLTAIMQGRIVVTVNDDFGDFIHSCILRIDNTALLQALHDRLEKIEQGEVPAFRADFAESVLKNAGSEQQRSLLDNWPWSQPPTANQKRFVEVALANEICWLWGPPGTGKTDTLSALIRLLYDRSERVLICSNTNQAVDQVLLKLCRKMRETKDRALDEGRVLRLGRIEDELRKEFGDFIEPDRIVERQSAALVQRQAHLEAELERLGREVSYADGVLRRFAELDAAVRSVNDMSREVQKCHSTQQQCETRLANSQRHQASVEAELQKLEDAGAIRRMFMRDETTIRRDLMSKQATVESARSSLNSAGQALAGANARHQQAARTAHQIQSSLATEDRAACQRIVSEYDGKRQPLRDELADIAKRLEEIRSAVISNARIVGATVTRTFLRPTEFSSFDSIIIDEASMMLLPAVFQIAGLATRRFVVAGDFQQLPPIVQTNQQAIYDVLAHDIFDEAEITIDTAEKTPRLVMLDEQFRMDDSICRLVSGAFYRGALQTHATRVPSSATPPEPLTQHLLVVDTSRIWPFTTRNTFNSRLNLMHGLATRNLVLHLRDHGFLRERDGKGRVGVCAPYAAQAALLREIFRSHEIDAATVRATTVHGFQGDEREMMILDLVDSVGERNAGIFLQASELADVGAKLLNVAFSRAKERIIVVANLTFLDRKLPSDAILRGLMHDVQRLGQIIDVREVLALRPVLDDLQRFGQQPQLDPEALRTGLFGAKDFASLSQADMDRAEKSIVVFSGFITPERTAQMGEVFRRRIARGAKIRCVTRPPNRNGTMPEEFGREALTALESIGVAIDLRNEIHEKVVLVDERISWFGSLNPLSHNFRTSELMARVDDVGVSRHIASILGVRRRSFDDDRNDSFADAENPRCGDCGGWTVFIRGKFGPFFSCEKNCGWKQNLDAVRRRRRD